MLLHVDAWNPGYGSGLETGDAGGGPSAESTAQLTPDVELPSTAWHPLVAPGGVRAPGVVLLVDGVRRLDAQVWITGPDGVTHGGLTASYAAGAVRCDLRNGVAEVAASQVRRGLFTPSPAAEEVLAGTARYPVCRTARDDPVALVVAVQERLRELEVALAAEARGAGGGDLAGGNGASGDRAGGGDRAAAGADGDDLLVIDGPLRGRAHLPRALGYIKSHRVEYLPPELSAVVAALRPGERCPVFRLGTSWHRYAWYLRLPGPAGSPWAGIVRVECSAELPVAAAVELADTSAVTLPRFASEAYKDPRAPQNLVPIAGLERRLRAMLGDARLLHRALTLAARGSTPDARGAAGRAVAGPVAGSVAGSRRP